MSVGLTPGDGTLALASQMRAARSTQRRTLSDTLKRVWFYRYIYFLMLPGLLYFVVFHYVPMWGIIVAFMDYRPWLGLFASPWVGFDNFNQFFNGPYFWRLIRNTLIISGLSIAFVFPAPIVLAILLNEVRHNTYKRVIQTISYLPHFISWVVVGGLLIYMFSVNVGFLTNMLASFGMQPIPILGSVQNFLPLVVNSGIWKEIGWGAIIYLAAIAGINTDMYEAATVDGANRFQRIWYITLPSIIPVIMIMLILRIGAILNVNFQQILILVGNDASLYEVGDVIDTWVYRVGFFQQQMGLATAVGVFKGIIGLALVVTANRVANKLTDSGLWN